MRRYAKDGVDPVQHREGNASGGTAIREAVPVTRRPGSSRFKGVTWNKGGGKWQAVCSRKFLGFHATEEAAAQAYNKYDEDGVTPVAKRCSSQFKGVCWNKHRGNWLAGCKGKNLGCHATEEAAAQPYDNYVEDGDDPVKRRSSQFKGVCWNKRSGKWLAKCKERHLGYHATEEASARAYNTEAERIGRVDDADDGNKGAAPAALPLLNTAAPAPTHAGADSKRSRRADAPTTPAHLRRKKMRLDGGVTGGRAASGGVTGGRTASRGVAGGGAASRCVTGGGVASGGVTGGGAASGGVTGGRVSAAAGAWAAAAAAAQGQHPLWWKFASPESRLDLPKAKAEAAKLNAKFAE